MRIDKLLLVPALVLGLGLVGCDVDQTEEGDMPDVEVEGGNVPEYDVEPAEVEVGTDTQTIETPDIDVDDPDDAGDM